MGILPPRRTAMEFFAARRSAHCPKTCGRKQTRELTIDKTNFRIKGLGSMSSELNRRVLAQAKRSVSNHQQADANTIDDETLHTIGVNFDEAFNEDPDIGNTEEVAED